jgi:hypothetical protein
MVSMKATRARSIHLRRCVLELEAGDEFREQPADLLGARLARARRLRPSEIGQVRQSAKRQRAGAEKQSAIDCVRPLYIFHGSFPPSPSILLGWDEGRKALGQRLGTIIVSLPGSAAAPQIQPD